MDRNTIIGFVLIIAILAGYYYYTKPSEKELADQKRYNDSIALVAKQKEAAAKEIQQKVNSNSNINEDSLIKLNSAGFDKHVGGNTETAILKNKHLTVKFTSKGGQIAEVQLNEHKNWNKKNTVVLFNEKNNQFFYKFTTPNAVIYTHKFNWSLKNKTESSVTFELTNANGGKIEQVYTLDKDAYTVDYKLNLTGLQNVFQNKNSDLLLVWNTQLNTQEKVKKTEEQNTKIYYQTSDLEIENTGFSDEVTPILANVRWFGFKQQFFNASLISKVPFDNGDTVYTKPVLSDSQVKEMHASMYLNYEKEEKKSYDFKFFFGPNHFNTLQKANVGIENAKLEKMVYLGWGFLAWINRYLVIPVFEFLSNYIGNMGIIILMLTLIVKFLLLPLVYKSYVSMAKMRILKPELDVIKDKYQGDLQKVQVENMALYKKAGVSPLSGCMPMLLTLPILFALFQFFPSSFELRQKAFLWCDDLSRYDSVLDFGFKIPGYGDHISLFTILMTISSLLYTWYNNQVTQVSGQMKYIGYIMPVIFLGVLNDYAAGLTWYYFVSNMITIGQQLVIKRFVDEDKLRLQMAEHRKKPVKKSGFQARMEAAMKQAQQQRNAKNSNNKKKK